jgi:hypothetical protein
LTKDPARRLGSGASGKDNIQQHPFFKDIDWKATAALAAVPPFIPKVNSPREILHFDEEFSSLDPVLTPPQPDSKKLLATVDPSEFAGFSFTNPHFLRSDV